MQPQQKDFGNSLIYEFMHGYKSKHHSEDYSGSLDKLASVMKKMELNFIKSDCEPIRELFKDLDWETIFISITKFLNEFLVERRERGFYEVFIKGERPVAEYIRDEQNGVFGDRWKIIGSQNSVRTGHFDRTGTKELFTKGKKVTNEK